jgi:hypothetical protein
VLPGFRIFEALEMADQDNDVRVIVIRGNGAAFCAGCPPGTLPTHTLLLQTTHDREPLPAAQTPLRAPRGVSALMRKPCINMAVFDDAATTSAWTRPYHCLFTRQVGSEYWECPQYHTSCGQSLSVL